MHPLTHPQSYAYVYIQFSKGMPMKKRIDWILCLEIAVNIRIKQMLVATDHFLPVERTDCTGRSCFMPGLCS